MPVTLASLRPNRIRKCHGMGQLSCSCGTGGTSSYSSGRFIPASQHAPFKCDFRADDLMNVLSHASACARRSMASAASSSARRSTTSQICRTSGWCSAARPMWTRRALSHRCALLCLCSALSTWSCLWHVGFTFTGILSSPPAEHCVSLNAGRCWMASFSSGKGLKIF